MWALRSVLCAAIALAGVAARGQTLEVSTLPEALDAALSGSPTIARARASRDVARAELDSARSQSNVRVDLNGSIGAQYTDTTAPFAFTEGGLGIIAADVQARLPIYTSGALKARQNAASAALAAQDFALSAEEQATALATITAYSDVKVARETRRIRLRNVDRLQEQRDATARRLDVGVVTRTDLALADARAEAARAGLALAEAELAVAEADFVEIVDLPAGSLAPLPPAPNLPETYDLALEIALRDNPALGAAEQSIEAARDAVAAERSRLGPQIDLVGRAATQEIWGNRQRETGVSVFAQATIPLYSGDQIRSRVRGARAEQAVAQADLDLVRRQIVSDLAGAWSVLLATRQSVRASEAQVMAAEVAFEGAEIELANGLRTTLDVLNAEQDLLDAQLALVAAKRDRDVATYRVLLAMGQLTPASAPIAFGNAEN